MSTSNIRGVVDRWRTEQVRLLPPAFDNETVKRLRVARLTFSKDVELLYSLCNGMPMGVVDGNWFELWPIERVIERSAAFPSPFIPFAEGFISAQLYCFKVESANIASIHIDYSHTGESPELLASSLDVAFGHLLNNPRALRLP